MHSACPETTGDCRYRTASSASSILYLNTWIFHKALSAREREFVLASEFVTSHPNSHPCTHRSPRLWGFQTAFSVRLHFIPGATRALLSVSPNHGGNVTRMSPEPLFTTIGGVACESCISSNEQMKEPNSCLFSLTVSLTFLQVYMLSWVGNQLLAQMIFWSLSVGILSNSNLALYILNWQISTHIVDLDSEFFSLSSLSF